MFHFRMLLLLFPSPKNASLVWPVISREIETSRKRGNSYYTELCQMKCGKRSTSVWRTSRWRDFDLWHHEGKMNSLSGNFQIDLSRKTGGLVCIWRDLQPTTKWSPCKMMQLLSIKFHLPLSIRQMKHKIAINYFLLLPFEEFSCRFKAWSKY